MRGNSRAWGWLASAAVLVGISGLGGCAAIPTTGPVEVGAGGIVADEGVLPIPPEIPEDDPVRLVDGFLKAAAAGFAGDFADVREYLTGSARSEWDPTAGVTIYGAGDFTPVWDQVSRTVTYSVPVAATLDEGGRMTEVPAGTRTTITFGVTSISDNRWRISSLDNGIVISEANFALVYRPVVLAFASRDLRVVVPDLRWLPRRNIATYASLALLGGPSPWLENAVTTGLALTAGLDVDAVPVEDGRAVVPLEAGSVDTAANRALAAAQFSQTLGGLPDVSEVAVTVGGLPLGGDGSVTLSRAPVPSPRAVVVVDGRIGVWDGGKLVVPSGSGTLPAGATDVALSWSEESVALLLAEGTLATATVPRSLVATDVVVDDLPLPLSVVAEGRRFVAPSFDRHGWLWTAEATGSGALIAIGPAGQRIDLPLAGAEGRDVSAIAVSRDGARVAVLSREGGLWRLGVTAIVRTSEGVPISAGAPLDVGVDVGPSQSMTWVDDNVIGLLGTSNVGETPSIRLVTVGGRTQVIAGVPDAVGLAGRSGTGSIMLVARDGSLYARSNTAWAPVKIGGAVLSLAYAG